MLTLDAAVAATVVADRGEGPPVVLLHGVGFGPASWEPVVEELVRSRRVLVVQRPPAPAGGVPLFTQAAAVARAVRDRVGDDPVTVAGGSGGATLGLALAIVAPELVGAAVVHEPLLGPLAPELHRAVSTEAEALASGRHTNRSWLSRLVGAEAWNALDDATRDGAAEGPSLFDDVRPFVEWAPSAAELATLRQVALFTTVGERSGPVRRAAAATLEALAGANVIVLDSVGHLVQLDAPRSFAALAAAASAGPRTR